MTPPVLAESECQSPLLNASNEHIKKKTTQLKSDLKVTAAPTAEGGKGGIDLDSAPIVFNKKRYQQQ